MKQFLLFTFLLTSILGVSAQSDAFRQGKFNLDDGLAIKGYDPVAYITDHKAVKGSKDFAASDHGVNVLFFVSSPQG